MARMHRQAVLRTLPLLCAEPPDRNGHGGRQRPLPPRPEGGKGGKRRRVPLWGEGRAAGEGGREPGAQRLRRSIFPKAPSDPLAHGCHGSEAKQERAETLQQLWEGRFSPPTRETRLSTEAIVTGSIKSNEDSPLGWLWSIEPRREETHPSPLTSSCGLSPLSWHVSLCSLAATHSQSVEDDHLHREEHLLQLLTSHATGKTN